MMNDRPANNMFRSKRAAPAPTARRRSRGQVIVIFAGAMLAFMGLMAIVIDVSWYWANTLRVQRAADAAALAGVVWLPDNFAGAAPNAQTTALAEAQKNGYIPGAGTTINMSQDPNNDRRLIVTVNTSVPSFFARVIGIASFPVSRTSKAEFILPVPMGSPQNYYGVGTFMNLPLSTTSYVNPAGYNAGSPTTGTNPTTNTTFGTTGGAWTNPGNAYATDAAATTSATNLNQDSWNTFAFGAISGATIDGVVVNVLAKVSTVNVACKIRTEVSWDSGNTWGNLPLTTPTLTSGYVWYPLGSTSNTAVWGGNHAPWAPADFASGVFRIRLTYLKGASCGTASVDEITAVVYSHTTTRSATPTVQPVIGPLGSALATQGFWGADITQGGSRENGDEYGPANDNLKGTSNPEFDGKGVDYNVVIAGPNGQVKLFDPTFCETGPVAGGGNFGAGDHWIGGSPNPVTTVYALYNINGTPFDPSDDIQVATSGVLFAGKTQADYSGDFGTPGHAGLTDCSADPYHNAWYALATGLPSGTYRLNVTTSVPGNASTNAENMWSAWVSSSTGSSQVYGQGKMVTYTNLIGGTQRFYLAQIAAVHAGKTMEIKLFDPGDVGGDAFLRILSPDGNAYNYASFSYTADNGRSGPAGTTQIQTASAASGSFYQDALITIQIPLPVTYGLTGLTPAGEPGAGWWKIEYTVNGGNDTTTWRVDIRGNPVHLVLP
jgi:Flp pilus assembly protein TadG